MAHANSFIAAGKQVLVASILMFVGSMAYAQSEGTMEAQEMREAQSAESVATAQGGTGEMRASMPGAAWSQFKRNLGVRFFNFTSNKMDQANLNGGRYESYSYFSLEYRLSRNEKIAIRPAFLLNSGGRGFGGEQFDSEFKWSDTYINYANYSWKWTPFDLDHSSSIRLYLPTSELSQERGMIARIRGYFIAGAPITSRLTYAIHFQPDYYIQKRTGYANDRGFANGNKNYGYDGWVELNYRINRMFSVASSIGHTQMWHHSVPIENVTVRQYENVTLETSVGINVGALSSSIGVSQNRNQLETNQRYKKEFSLFRDDETQYFARSYYRF